MKDNFIKPQNNSYFVGQTKAENILLQAWKKNSLPHAWIFSGKRGIGKATLAYRFARFLLWADKDKSEQYTSLNVNENTDVFKQVAALSNPNLMVVERDFIDTDKQKIIKAIQQGEPLSDDEIAGLRKSANIKVDDIRKIVDFYTKTSFNNGWRIVIIDCADELNTSAANAFLKILEEPPAKSLLMLISHNIGALLPTIKSRCSKIALPDLSNDNVASLLRRYRPELNETQIAKLVELSEGSIGKAVTYADIDIIDFYNRLCALFYKKNNFTLADLLDFCDEAVSNEDKFRLLPELVGKFIKDNMLNCTNAEDLYKCWRDSEAMFAACDGINMDKKTTLVNLINRICKVL
jgi:DNA polymerase-3 subunit delta'